MLSFPSFLCSSLQLSVTSWLKQFSLGPSCYLALPTEVHSCLLLCFSSNIPGSVFALSLLILPLSASLSCNSPSEACSGALGMGAFAFPSPFGTCHWHNVEETASSFFHSRINNENIKSKLFITLL